jgi:hypothetical protein
MPRPRLTASRATVAALTLAACSPYSLGSPPADPELATRPFTPYLDGMASVCVIRTARLALAVTVVVHDNDVLVGATRGASYFCYRAQPGRHRIVMASEDGSQRFEVDLDERGRYYFDQGLDFDFGHVVPHGTWVDEARARELVGRSEHLLLQGAPATETLLVGTDVVSALPDPPAGPAGGSPPPPS